MALERQVKALDKATASRRQHEVRAKESTLRSKRETHQRRRSRKWLKRCEKLGWYNTLVCDLAIGDQMDQYKCLSIDKDFF